MSGVSADTPNTSVEGELAAIYAGGDNFLARMKAMTKLRDEQQASFMALKLGNDAVAALGNAKSIESEAKEDRRKAADELSAARAQAKGMVEKATSEAARAALEASRRVAAAEAHASGLVASASKEADAARSEANRLLEQAKEKMRELEIKIAAAEEARAAHLRAEADHLQASELKGKHIDAYRSVVSMLKDAMAKAEEHTKRVT